MNELRNKIMNERWVKKGTRERNLHKMLPQLANLKSGIGKATGVITSFEGDGIAPCNFNIQNSVVSVIVIFK